MATKKTYKAFGSVVHLTMFIGMRNVEINFTPVSNYISGEGGSEYTTSNPSIQRALERSKNFGSMYVLVKEETDDADNAANESDNKENENGEEKKLQVIQVASWSDAKAWLVDNCDWKPKSRWTKASVKEAAASYGYTFEGLN